MQTKTLDLRSLLKHSTLRLILSLILLSTIAGPAAVMVGPGAGVNAVTAATITVTTFADELNFDGDCSLREAVQAASMMPGMTITTYDRDRNPRPSGQDSSWNHSD